MKHSYILLTLSAAFTHLAVIYGHLLGITRKNKCQLVDYGEETRRWLWFIKIHFIHNYQLTI